MIEKSLTAPRKKKVKGQLHELSYITPKEAKLLQKSGGVKTKTSEGIFAYPPPGERGGPGSGSEGRAPGGEGRGEYRSPPAPKPAPNRVSPIQSIAMTGDISLAGKTQDEAQASVDRDNAMRQVDIGFQEALKKQNIQKPIDDAKEDYISKQYKQPVTRKKINLPKETGIKSLDTKKLIDTEPKIDVKDAVQRGLFNTLVAKPAAQKLGLGAFFGPLGLLGGMLFSKLTGKKAPNAYDVTTDLLSNVNLGTGKGTKNNILNALESRDGIQANIVSGGGDVVTQKIKEFTGEQPTEKVAQQTDSKQSQLLLMLKKLQEYDSQNRLNDRGKQYLAQLTSFMNQPLPGRSRDI
tara:strand:+ start:45 stop:1094 length:1050 start_codon:yes stop_codon:yes gene_type:complete